MSEEFYKRFLMDDGRRLAPDSGRFVALGAFGKHPGWDDHVEDLGLETDSLILAKRIFYVQGVGGRIDTGAWEKLRDEQRIAIFNHAFVWQRGDQFLAGRMWSSSDGKGRTRYPMIVCAHGVGVPLVWVLDTVLSQLTEIESACQTTKSADDVRSILTRGRAALRNALANAPAAARMTPTTDALRQFVAANDFGPAREGWFRILYWIQSQARSFGIGNFNLKGDLSGLRAQQLRLPLAGLTDPASAVPIWSRFFSSFIDPQVPALFVWPLGRDWVDVTFGEPSSDEFFCLRAARGAIPFATEIPYDIDQKFRQQAARQLEEFENGRPARAADGISEKDGDDEKQSGFISVTQRWFKSLGGKGGLFLIALLLLAAAAFAILRFLPRGEKQLAAGAAPAASVPAPARNQRAPPGASNGEFDLPPTPRLTNPTPPAQAEPRDAEAEARAAARADALLKAAQAEAAEKARLAAEAEARRAAEAKNRETQITNASIAAREETPPATTQATSAPVLAVFTPGKQPDVPPAAQDATAAARPTADRKILTNGIGMVLVWIAGLPGSGEGGWVGKYEVTQAEYQKVAGSAPGKFHGPEQPVENVSWREASDFCRKLGELEEAANRLPVGFAYALPTQQQWDFFLADASFENAVTSRGSDMIRTSPERVGTKPPNRYGLCDVLGNVWEWCADGGPSGPKPLRGGAFDNRASFQFKALEPSTVRRAAEDAKSPDAGFRCVLVRQP